VAGAAAGPAPSRPSIGVEPAAPDTPPAGAPSAVVAEVLVSAVVAPVDAVGVLAPVTVRAAGGVAVGGVVGRLAEVVAVVAGVVGVGVVEVLDGAGVVGLEVVGRGVGETGVVVAGAGVCVRVEVGTGRGVGVGRIGRAVSLPRSGVVGVAVSAFAAVGVAARLIPAARARPSRAGAVRRVDMGQPP